MDEVRHVSSAAAPLSSRFFRPVEDRPSQRRVSTGAVVDVALGPVATTSVLHKPPSSPLSCISPRISAASGGLCRSEVPPPTEGASAVKDMLLPGTTDIDSGQRDTLAVAPVVVDMTPLTEVTQSTSEALRLAVTLDISSKKLGDAKLSSLLPCVGELTQLRGLWLANNDIKGDTVKASTGCSKSAAAECGTLWENVDKALRRLPELQSLTLHNNTIGPRGAEALAQTLPSLAHLEVLSLHNNPLGAEGVQHVCRALPSLGRLVLLYLSNTNMGDDGAAALGGAVVCLGGLRKLYAAANGITDRGAYSLLEAFHHLPKLQEVLLQSNVISGDGVAALRTANVLNLVV